jgi:hypothetical protein
MGMGRVLSLVFGGVVENRCAGLTLGVAETGPSCERSARLV